MAAGPNVGAQLVDMLNDLRRYDNTAAGAGPQGTDLSFMTLLWPLLPLLPPEPPALLTGLLREREKCDLCGTSQGSSLRTPGKTRKSGNKPEDATDSTLRRRTGSDWKTPLDRLMMDIENNMSEVLESIQETTEKNTELSKKANEIEKLQTSEISDAELLRTLKKLTKEKAERTEKVRILEAKEQQLKESLKNAIEWAKSVELNKSNPDSEKVALENNTTGKDPLPSD